MCELSKQFHFDVAHTLERAIEMESNRPIHHDRPGDTYSYFGPNGGSR